MYSSFNDTSDEVDTLVKLDSDTVIGIDNNNFKVYDVVRDYCQINIQTDVTVDMGPDIFALEGQNMMIYGSKSHFFASYMKDDMVGKDY